ncbi:MAG: DNA-binding protein [Methylomonas sp.]|nr:MAG: DNA-binding protein [Methylomonas sp.]
MGLLMGTPVSLATALSSTSHPTAGDVIPGADGARKVRWSVAGKGKRGGVRVIYFNLTEQGTVVLVTLYTKADQANIQASNIKKAV